MILETFSALLAPAALRAVSAEGQFGTLRKDRDSVSTILSQENRPHLPSEFRLSNVEELVPEKIHLADVEITLLERPVCVLRRGMTVFVRGWGVECAYENVYDIPRELARRFLFLLGKAQNGSLTDEERVFWAYIVDHIDYPGYCESRSRAIQCEGLLKERQRNAISIEWADGSLSNLSGALVSRFDLVNVGERFSCVARFRSQKITDLFEVSPLEALETDDWSWIERPA
jgi:hypothetical protein